MEVIIERRRQRTGPELYGGPLCDCCFFLSTPATVIAGLMADSNKTAAVKRWTCAEEPKNLLYLRLLCVSVYIYVCVRERFGMCLIDMRAKQASPMFNIIIITSSVSAVVNSLNQDNGCIIAAFSHWEPREGHHWEKEFLISFVCCVPPDVHLSQIASPCITG